MSIRKEEIKKHIKELPPEEKIEIKKSLDTLSFDKEVEVYFEKLKGSKSKKERNELHARHRAIIANFSVVQQNDMLSIFAHKTAEEYNRDDAYNYNDEDPINNVKEPKLREQIQQYKQRAAQEVQEKQETKRIASIEVTDDAIQEAIKKADVSRKLTVKDDWCKLFNKISKNNELCGEILFHSFMGQLCDNIFIYDGDGKRILLKIDFFWIQNSSSGKGEALDNFFKPIIDEFTWREKDIGDGKIKNKKLSYSSFKGQSTLAGMLNRFKRDKRGKGYTEEIIHGPIERSNFWIWTEANDLLSPNNYNQKLIDGMLDLMEGKIYEAFLEKYDQPISTRGTGSLIATSRIVKNVEYFLIKSGLLHRCLAVMRNLKDYQMEETVSKIAVKSFGAETNRSDFDIERQKLIKKLREIKEWSLDKNYKTYPQKDPDLLNRIMEKKLSDLMKDAKRDVKVKPFRETLCEYISRMRNKAIAIAYHNAIVRRDAVDVQDIAGAFQLLGECYDNLKHWMFENVSLKDSGMDRDFKLYTAVTRLLAQHPTHSMSRVSLRKAIEKNRYIHYSGNYLYIKFKELVENYPDEFAIKNDRIIYIKEE